MSTLEQQRRAIGRRMTAERKALGEAMIETRRGIGQRIRDDIERTLRPERQTTALPAVDPRGAQGERRSRSVYSAPVTGGGGIAGPLTEADASAREYWPSGLRSSDGLFTLPAIKKLVLADANGAEVVIQLADPRGTA